jgi:hypothetical protein
VSEPVLDVPLQPARGLAPDEVAALELVERLVEVVVARDGREDVAPERAADDRRDEDV